MILIIIIIIVAVNLAWGPPQQPNGRQEDDDAEPAVARDCARTRGDSVGETNLCPLTGKLSSRTKTGCWQTFEFPAFFFFAAASDEKWGPFVLTFVLCCALFSFLLLPCLTELGIQLFASFWRGFGCWVAVSGNDYGVPMNEKLDAVWKEQKKFPGCGLKFYDARITSFSRKRRKSKGGILFLMLNLNLINQDNFLVMRVLTGTK